MVKINSKITALFLLWLLSLTCCSKSTVSSQSKTTTPFFVFEHIEPVQYTYDDEIKRYLLAGPDADILNFDFAEVSKQAKDVVVSWSAKSCDITDYIFSYSTSSDFSNSINIELDESSHSFSFRFLLKNAKYFFKVSACYKGVHISSSGDFRTTSLGPRFLDVGDSLNNCRDLGGYRCGDNIIKQNTIIRGSYPSQLSHEGYHYLSFIKTQLDLRGHGESIEDTTSNLKNAVYFRRPCVAYGDCFEEYQKEYYKELFKVFANSDNYPIYFHCWGGADRTGTVAAILLGFLGVSKGEIIQDFVLTSFSSLCDETNYRKKEDILTVLDGMDRFEGTTLSEKCSNYLLSIGLTLDELQAIKDSAYL